MKNTIKSRNSIFKIALFMSLVCFGTNAFGQKQGAKSDSRAPLVKASVKTSHQCRAGHTCGTWLGSMQKVNALKITNQSYSWYPSLRVDIYNCPGPVPSTSCLIESFVCNQLTILYASTKLTNGGTFYVKLTDTQSNNSVGYNFTNGNHKGKICGSSVETGPK